MQFGISLHKLFNNSIYENNVVNILLQSNDVIINKEIIKIRKILSISSILCNDNKQNSICNLSFYCIALNWFSSHSPINTYRFYLSFVSAKRFKYRVFPYKAITLCIKRQEVSSHTYNSIYWRRNFVVEHSEFGVVKKILLKHVYVSVRSVFFLNSAADRFFCSIFIISNEKC